MCIRHKLVSIQMDFRVAICKFAVLVFSIEVMGEKDYEVTYKILILGDSGVGKTCLIFRFIEDIFSDSYISTIGKLKFVLFVKTSQIPRYVTKTRIR